MKSITEEERKFLLFVAPKSFDEVPSNLEMWNSYLRGTGHLIVFSNDFQTHKASALKGISTLCIEHSLDGFPRFDLMMAKMEQMQPDGVVAFVNTDLEVTHSGMNEVVRVTKWIENKQPLDLMMPKNFLQPYHYGNSSTKFWFAALNRWDEAKDGGGMEVHDAGGYDLWAWNIHPGGPSLLPFDIPPFRFPLASYDNWLFDIVNKEATRNVINITGAAKFIHKEHSRKNYYQLSYQPADSSIGFYFNRYLALNEPSLSSTSLLRHCIGCGTMIGAPYSLSRINEEDEFSLKKTKIYQHINNKKQSPEAVEKMTTKKRNSLIPISDVLATSTMFSMEALLSERATKEGFVLLTAVSYNYREYLLNLICNLERLGNSFQHMVIAALDKEMYDWGALRGLPVFLPSSQLNDKNTTVSSGYDYGSQNFRAMTKLKSRSALEVMNAGYSVVYSDVDITWFQDPFESLRPYTMKNSTALMIQSNAPYAPHLADPEKKYKPHDSVSGVHSEQVSNGYRRINSGMYVAPNSALMRIAFEEITSAAAVGTLSEQPYFYGVLCYKLPSHTVGGDGCEFHPRLDKKYLPSSKLPSFLPVHMFERLEYPHGAVAVGSNALSIYTLGVDAFEKVTGKKAVLAHNNWIVGRDAKKQRQVDNDWWYIEKGFCKYMGD